MEEAAKVTEVLANIATIAEHLTVVGLLLWVVTMFLTGRIIRREELDAERVRTETERTNGTFWRDRYLGVFTTAQESISSLSRITEGIRDAMTSLRATVEAALSNNRRPR
jgi:hypothetical protein